MIETNKNSYIYIYWLVKMKDFSYTFSRNVYKQKQIFQQFFSYAKSVILDDHVSSI